MAYKGHENMFQHEELVGSSWIGAYSALCFSCGHVAYGQLDMLRYRLYSGWIPGILLHHLILLICFTLALHRNVTINYLIFTLLCEVLPCSFQSLLSMNYHPISIASFRLPKGIQI
uniref:TLC domain-containing protein n=2 Tax=Triticinae TaxID=1648030 RepID=A0A453G0I8_AEGTS